MITGSHERGREEGRDAMTEEEMDGCGSAEGWERKRMQGKEGQGKEIRMERRRYMHFSFLSSYFLRTLLFPDHRTKFYRANLGHGDSPHTPAHEPAVPVSSHPTQNLQYEV